MILVGDEFEEDPKVGNLLIVDDLSLDLMVYYKVEKDKMDFVRNHWAIEAPLKDDPIEDSAVAEGQLIDVD